jgi:hypothetical protein
MQKNANFVIFDKANQGRQAYFGQVKAVETD